MPCLHTLLTPTGLNLLKSAPLMSAFPVTPPRAPPSPAPLLASIRSLIQSGSLSGPAWKSTATWRAQIRKAFAAYHALLKDVAEELVTARSFAEEFHLFLDQIAQPIQLLQLIADDFESEFGPGATRGLLGVGEAGGDNLISVMDFCAARKPSELIARVKQRVAEKQERERRTKLLDKLKVELKELDVRIRGLLLEYRSASGTGSATGDKSKGVDASAAEKTTAAAEAEAAAVFTVETSSSDLTQDALRSTQTQLDGAVEIGSAEEKAERSSRSIRLQQELEAALDERDRVKAELEDLRATEEADEVARKKRAVAEKKGLTMVPPPLPRSGGDEPEVGREGEGAPREEEAGFKLGSSRDLLAVPGHLAASREGDGQLQGDAPFTDPFSTSAPRAVSPAAGSAKGKAKAVTQAGKVCWRFWSTRDARLLTIIFPVARKNKPRTAARFAPPPPQHCYNRPQPPTLDDVLRSGGPRATTNDRSSSLANRPMTTTSSSSPSQKRPSSPPASAGSSRSPTRSRKLATSTTTNKSARSTKLAKKRAQAKDEHCEICCPACQAAQQQKLAVEERQSPATVAERPSRASRDEADPMDMSEVDSSSAPLRDKTNLAANPSTCADPIAATKALSAKKKRKKKRVAASQALDAAASSPADAGVETESLTAPPAAAILPTPLKQRFGPLSRIPPPKLCPPHICTGIAPRYDQWEELDALLYETLLAGFKCTCSGSRLAQNCADC